MAERSLTPVKAQQAEGTEAWARAHRDSIQVHVRARAANASALMREVEKIRPENPGGAGGGRLPQRDPRTGKPWAHVLLGFPAWSDFVKARQPEGLGWSPSHERSMWLGWRKAKKAGISPELVDELGQAWLSAVGQNKGGAADDLTPETARATADERRDKRLNPPERKKSDQLPARRKKDDARPRSDQPPRTVRALSEEFASKVAPTVDAKSALRVTESVLPRLDPQDLVLVAEEVVTKLESEHVEKILVVMVPMLDAEETWTLARAATRRLETEALERLAKEVDELLVARREHEEAGRRRMEAVAEAAAKEAVGRKAAQEEKKAQDEQRALTRKGRKRGRG